tara:strand:+ start:1067 stop:1636 length:570 start_codon:yes stop_codon:yes gene_type:complete
MRGASIKGSKISKTSKIESGSNVINTNMGRHSFAGYNCEISNCEIGSFTSIANNVVIGGGEHPTNWVSMSPVFYKGRDSVKAKFSKHRRDPIKLTKIGHDVWIGEKAILKQGVKVGNGAVIGMGSVVTKNIDPYTIVAGCPAKVLRKRFDDKIISDLLNSEWWNLNDEDLKNYANYFKNPKTFLEKLEN